MFVCVMNYSLVCLFMCVFVTESFLVSLNMPAISGVFVIFSSMYFCDSDVGVCLCVYVCMYVCMYLCIYMCVCVCVVLPVVVIDIQ